MLILHCIAIPPIALQLASYPPARQLLQRPRLEIIDFQHKYKEVPSSLLIVFLHVTL
jgi:hypothetical protein